MNEPATKLELQIAMQGIANFFEAAFAERLLAEFPKFDPKLAIAENGTVGAKAVNSRIGEIGPVYR